jgi:hypothetical protein
MILFGRCEARQALPLRQLVRLTAQLPNGSKSRLSFAVLMICVYVLQIASANAQTKATTATPVVVVTPAEKVPVPVAVKLPAELAGFGFGIGIATNFDVGGARVGNVSVVNNIVRVDDASNNVNISFVVEAHYFLQSWNLKLSRYEKEACEQGRPFTLNCTQLAHGPFVAMEFGGGTSASTVGSGPVSGYAMGWMVGMRHLNQPANYGPSSWNFGLGLRVTPNAKVLGDGIVANQPLPPGENANPVRTKAEPRYGVMLMSTFSF